MRELRTLVICPAVNDDLVAIAAAVADGISPTGWDWIGALPPSGASHVREEQYLFKKYSASSLAQVRNVAVLEKLAVAIRNAGNVLLSCPSVLNFPIVSMVRSADKQFAAIVHDVDTHYSGLRGIVYDAQTKYILRHASRVFVFSKYSENRASERGARNVITLPLPSPAEFISEQCADQAKVAPVYDLGFFGRFEEYKGIRLLPSIAAEGLRRGLTFLVATHADDSDPLVQELSEFGNVSLVLGRRPTSELVALMTHTSWNLCPYISATQSGVVAFASVCGTPSAVSAVGGLKEQITVGVTGCVLPLEELVRLEWLRNGSYDVAPREIIRSQYLSTSSFEIVTRRTLEATLIK